MTDRLDSAERKPGGRPGRDHAAEREHRKARSADRPVTAAQVPFQVLASPNVEPALPAFPTAPGDADTGPAATSWRAANSARVWLDGGLVVIKPGDVFTAADLGSHGRRLLAEAGVVLEPVS